MDVTVQVTEARTEAPIERARVEIVKFPDELVQYAFTDSTGRWEFHGVSPGSYRVRASKPDYVATEVRVDLRPEERSKDVYIRMAKVRSGGPPDLGGTVSARLLSIPKPAAKEFREGLEALNKKKDPHLALLKFQAAIDAFPNYYEAYFMMGMAYLQLKSYTEAQTSMEKSISMEPGFVDPYYPLAVLLISRKQYAQAERLLLKGMQLDGKNWLYPFELARCEAKRRSWDKALEYGRAALSMPGAPPKVHLLMADLYSNTGHSEEAIKELQEFEKLNPQSPYMPRVREALQKLQAQQ